MDAGISGSSFPHCSEVKASVTSIHRSTRGGGIGESRLNDLTDHYLERGERLCYRWGDRGAQEWFRYREDAQPVKSKPEPAQASTGFGEQKIFDHLISGLLVVAGLAIMSYMLSVLGRAAFETSSIVPPPAEGADVERPAAVEVPEVIYEVEQDAWKKEGWWSGLGDSEQEIARMIIEQDLRPALETRAFVEMYVRDGRVSADGIAYLIDSRDGNLPGRTDMRVGSLRVERRKVEKKGPVIDIERSLKRGRK